MFVSHVLNPSFELLDLLYDCLVLRPSQCLRTNFRLHASRIKRWHSYAEYFIFSTFPSVSSVQRIL
jgi:hypothetical protein